MDVRKEGGEVKPGLINRRWCLILPDQIADWDAITGWEIERIESMHRNLKWGDCLWEIGAEHGWMAALYAREFVGGENMVLVEPSIEMWRNIWLTWGYNDLRFPVGFWPGFVSHSGDNPPFEFTRAWPKEAMMSYDECPAMPYRSLVNPDDEDVPVTTIDKLVAAGIRPPDAISIDVEGAELSVLRGAWDTLRTHHPKLWVSVHDGAENGDRNMMLEDYGDSVDLFVGFLNAAGYDYRWLNYDHEHHLFAWHQDDTKGIFQ